MSECYILTLLWSENPSIKQTKINPVAPSNKRWHAVFTLIACSYHMHIGPIFAHIQCHAEFWWCLGQLLGCMPPYQIIILSSSIWWVSLLDMLFVTSRYDVLAIFVNQRFAEVCWCNMHIILHALFTIVRCVAIMTINYQCSKLRDRS